MFVILPLRLNNFLRFFTIIKNIDRTFLKGKGHKVNISNSYQKGAVPSKRVAILPLSSTLNKLTSKWIVYIDLDVNHETGVGFQSDMKDVVPC